MYAVVVYDECIKKDERSENFHTMNERVARELIRAFQHVCLKKNCKIREIAEKPVERRRAQS